MKKRESSSSEGELGAPPPAPPTELPVEFKANKKFKEGESCRSLDQGKLYPAKVLKCGDDDAYFIHYQVGFNAGALLCPGCNRILVVSSRGGTGSGTSGCMQVCS